MMTPTAMSTTLPFMANCLNSEARLMAISLVTGRSAGYATGA
jgi:hypothetical protein